MFYFFLLTFHTKSIVVVASFILEMTYHFLLCQISILQMSSIHMIRTRRFSATRSYRSDVLTDCWLTVTYAHFDEECFYARIDEAWRAVRLHEHAQTLNAVTSAHAAEHDVTWQRNVFLHVYMYIYVTTRETTVIHYNIEQPPGSQYKFR